MMKRKIGGHLLLGAALAISTLTLQHKAWAINVPLVGQEQSNWCWAATGNMLGVFFNVGRSELQCLQASHVFGGDCCGNEASCNYGGWSLNSLNWWGLHSTDSGYYSMTQAQVQNEVAHKRPWSHSLWWCYDANCTSVGSHEVTGIGGYSSGGTYWIQINDPDPVGTGEAYTESYAIYIYDNVYYSYVRNGWDDLYNIHW